jgi:hypothetical protein
MNTACHRDYNRCLRNMETKLSFLLLAIKVLSAMRVYYGLLMGQGCMEV